MEMASPTQQVDLRSICKELGSIKTKWHEIGVSLGIPYTKLQQFKKEDDPLSAAIDFCLRGNTDKPLTWQFIAAALRSDYVGEPGIATKIEMAYCCQTDFKGPKVEPPSQRSKSEFQVKPNIRMDLEAKIESNLEDIVAKFTSYADCIRGLLEERGTTPEEFQFYLLTLSATTIATRKLTRLSHWEDEIRACKTITALCTFLTTKCVSFLNYEIFVNIIKNYQITSEDERLKYPDHLKAFINEHKISEFAKINPELKKLKSSSSKELILKCDIEKTCDLAQVDQLKRVIAKVLKINPSTLEIIDIDDGCVIVTFITSASVADALFTPDTVFTEQQEEELRAHSVLWMKCNGYTYNFKYRDQLKATAEVRKELQRAMAKLNACCDELAFRQNVIQEEISKTIKLDARKAELINNLHQLTQAKLRSVAEKGNQIDIIQTQLNKNLHYASDMKELETMNVRQATELITEIEPNVEADIIFVAMKESSTGEVYGLVSAGPPQFKCQFKGKTTIGEMTILVIKTVDFNNLPCVVPPLESIGCLLVHEESSATTDCCVEGMESSTYEISYRATIEGKHQLHVTVENQHIWGSPFPVFAMPPPWTILTTISRPDGITVNQEDELIVTTWSESCVAVLGSSGEKVLSFGTQGSGCGQLQYPSGVAVDDKGNILVADSINHSIQKFTARGKFLASVGKEGSGSLQFDTPRGIAFNTINQRFYVAEEWNNRVQILNSDLSYAGKFGKEGSVQGEFSSPWDIACDSSGNVYVTDCDNHRIQVFIAEGQLLRTFGGYGDGRGELIQPYGIAIDSFRNRVYVGEWGNQRISVFTTEGDFVFSFDIKGEEGDILLTNPCGLTVNSGGVLYVCDVIEGCVFSISFAD